MRGILFSLPFHHHWKPQHPKYPLSCFSLSPISFQIPWWVLLLTSLLLAGPGGGTGVKGAPHTKERALLEIVLYEQVPNGDVKTYEFQLNGHFTAAGALGSAEGQIVQIHPMGLCNDGDFEESIRSHKDYGWVVVVKLELPQFDPDPCMSIYNKAKRAIQRGATAVVFDVTDNQRAAKQLRTAPGPPLARPVVIVRGKEADRLMNIVNTQKQARARIKSLSATNAMNRSNSKEFFNMGIFLAFFVLFCIVCLTVILKLKWRQRTRQQLSMSEIAKRTLEKLETRKYKCPPSRQRKLSHSACSETDSNVETCAVCLEEYRDTQDIRILPCSHEFHRSCVDPWLISNHTCPLCLFNILERPAVNDGSPCSTPGIQTGHASGNTNTASLLPHPHHSINNINNNLGHLNNLNMAGFTMGLTTSASNANLVYPSTSHVTYTHYGQQRIVSADHYYAVQPGSYQAYRQYAGLEYNQIEAIPMSTASVAFSSHGNPPHYGLPLYSSHCQQASAVGGSSDGGVTTKKVVSRMGTKAPMIIAGKRVDASSSGTSQRHGAPAVPPRHSSTLSSSRKGSTDGTSRIPRPGRARPVPPPPPPLTQWTSSESDADLYHTKSSNIPKTHQVVLHQQFKTPLGESESDSCSCGALSESNIDCSNQSTLGSSDMPSDVSSFESNAYCSKSPDDTDIVHRPQSPVLPVLPALAPTHLKPACVSSRSRNRTNYTLHRRKADSNNSPSYTLRHSCHGDVYDKHGSVEAMLPPTLKSKLKQSGRKTHHVVQKSALLSSDNSVSSLDTTGMSPIVSDWYPSSSSSGSESNEQICRNCQTQTSPELADSVINNLANSMPTSGLAYLHYADPESGEIAGVDEQSMPIHGQSERDSHCLTDDPSEYLETCKTLPLKCSKSSSTTSAASKYKYNIPSISQPSISVGGHNKEDTHSKISGRNWNNPGNKSTNVVSSSNLLPHRTKLHNISNTNSKLSTFSSNHKVSAPHRKDESQNGHHGPKATGSGSPSCHTCETLRSSLKIVRASMLVDTSPCHSSSSDHDSTLIKKDSSNRSLKSKSLSESNPSLLTSKGLSPASTSLTTSRRQNKLVRSHTADGATGGSSTSRSVSPVLKQRKSLVIYTEGQGSFTIPLDCNEDISSLNVV